jgi:hypothetical protein
MFVRTSTVAGRAIPATRINACGRGRGQRRRQKSLTAIATTDNSKFVSFFKTQEQPPQQQQQRDHHVTALRRRTIAPQKELLKEQVARPLKIKEESKEGTK